MHPLNGDFHPLSTRLSRVLNMPFLRGMLLANHHYPMKKAAFWVALTLILIPVSRLHSQTGIRPPQGWSLGLMGGAAAFSDMQRGRIRVFRPTDVGMESRELARRVGAETATALGGYLSYWPSRNWGLRLNASYAPTRFETYMRESEADFAGLPPSSDSTLAALNIVTAELQALFRLPTIKNRVLLYGIVGGGVARYDVASGTEPLPAEAEGEFDGGHTVRPGGMFGLGAMLPFRNRAFRLHFELTNHLTGTPINGGEEQTVQLPHGEIEFNPRDEPSGDERVAVINAVRFMVGASWSPKR
jgi:hypothetical protein